MLRPQVALRHLAHALGEHQQRPGELVAERHRQQQRAEHRQDQRQRQRADVHAAQAVAGQRALLVLAVGGLHRQRIGRQRRCHELGDEQEAVMLAEREVDLRDQRDGADAGRPAGRCGRWLAAAVRRLLVEAFELARHRRHARLAQQRRRRPVGGEAGRAADAEQRLAGAADDRHLARRQLLAQPLQRHRLHVGLRIGQPLGGQPGLRRQIGDLRVERAAAEIEAGVERALDLDVEPALDAARDELVGDGVDQQPRHHADEGEGGDQPQQQPAAEAATPQPHHQPHGGHHDGQRQQAGDDRVDPEQPDIVLFVGGAVAGGDRQQEEQHQPDAAHRHRRGDPGPARGSGHACAVLPLPPSMPPPLS